MTTTRADEPKRPLFGDICDPFTKRYDPFTHLGLGFRGVYVRFAELEDDEVGEVNFNARTITLQRGISAHEARSTLAHELVHLERGPAPLGETPSEEAVVDLVAASRLLPVAELEGLAGRVKKEGIDAVALSLEADEGVVRVGMILAAAVRAVRALTKEPERVSVDQILRAARLPASARPTKSPSK